MDKFFGVTRTFKKNVRHGKTDKNAENGNIQSILFGCMLVFQLDYHNSTSLSPLVGISQLYQTLGNPYKMSLKTSIFVKQVKFFGTKTRFCHIFLSAKREKTRDDLVKPSTHDPQPSISCRQVLMVTRSPGYNTTAEEVVVEEHLRSLLMGQLWPVVCTCVGLNGSTSDRKYFLNPN